MIQLQVLNKIINDNDTSLISLNNLNEEYFSEYSKEFSFIKDHIDKYSNAPDMITIISHFPDFRHIEVREDTNYLINELLRDRNSRYLRESFNSVREFILKNDTESALAAYRNAYDKLSTSTRVDSIDLLKDTTRYEEYIKRTEDFTGSFIHTGFPELDRIIGGWDREEELATIVARTNYGKCLAKGTEVLLADGTLKKVEDVVVGDRVQSLNRVNNVLALHTGVSKGYKIIPNVGEPFIVSENHILTIMQLKKHWDNNRKQTVTNNDFELKDIMVEDYLKLSNHKKHISKLYRPEIEYATKEQLIPPYILGSWLGDGTSREVSITSMDSEIIKEWENFANTFGYTLFAHKNTSGNKAMAYSIYNKRGCINEVTELFKKYNLLDNKHIPLNYLTGDRNQRLELLAGLIDTDGSLENGSFSITQKSKDLIIQISQLCRGLGLKVGKINTKYNKKYNKEYYRICISGNLKMVPCRLDRKIKNVTSKQEKYILTGFKVEPVERVEYYGFMCDGDSRYLLADNTLTHNTWILLKSAAEAVKQGLNVGIYSGEMSERKVGYRIDTLLSHISNGGLVHGNDNIKNEYSRYIKELPNKYSGSLKVLTPAMIHGPAGVSALRAFIEQEDLDILFIDQHSLLEDDRHAKSPVEKAANISRDLKNLQVLKRIPIISVSQQNRNSTENGVDTTMIAQSDRIGQDSTVILFLEKKDNDITLSLVKSRDTANGIKLSYTVDFNTGYFHYNPDEDNPNDAEDIKKLADRYAVVEESNGSSN